MSTLLALVKPPAPLWVSETLQATLLVLVAAGAFVVVTCRQPVRQVVLLSMYGIVLALTFFSLQAPDVTLSEITVGTVILPLLLLLTLSKLKGQEHEET